jgi:serine/threonine protein kinase
MRALFVALFSGANILLSRSTGAVKLADFGASRQLTDTMTKCNTFVGSPYWMVSARSSSGSGAGTGTGTRRRHTGRSSMTWGASTCTLTHGRLLVA